MLRRLKLDAVNGAFAYEGGQDWSSPALASGGGRRSKSIDAAGTKHTLYLKRYGPERLGAKVGRFFTYRRPGSPARTEFANIAACSPPACPRWAEIAYRGGLPRLRREELPDSDGRTGGGSRKIDN